MQRIYAQSADLYRLLSFGQVPFVVDWLLIRSMTEDPSVSHVAKGVHPPAYYDLNMATELDPAFAELYTVGAMLLSVIRDDGVGAESLLSRGNKFRKEQLPFMPGAFREMHWRQPWQITMILAYVELFDMKNMPAAAVAFRETAEIPGSPLYLKNLVRRLEAPGGYYDVAIGLAKTLRRQHDSGPMSVELDSRLRSLSLQKELWELNTKFAEKIELSKVQPKQIDLAWEKLVKSGVMPRVDSEGGELFITETGKIQTKTKFERVMGLD